MGNYALVSVLDLGIRGSAYANIISQFAQTIFLLLYIMLKKLHLETWAGGRPGLLWEAEQASGGAAPGRVLQGPRVPSSKVSRCRALMGPSQKPGPGSFFA
ncbi:hypothetical protein P7K49_010809 [Saguinus oedipus]|uniref:Solute carrier family 66 member 3 n=1 Tax=Saguinus oedipus TaxID=9490 RepID=A0ABQ9VNU8_SAGOE|nr:hypothetical protein P7K49_010809 [Saguinus oedipus]